MILPTNTYISSQASRGWAKTARTTAVRGPFIGLVMIVLCALLVGGCSSASQTTQGTQPTPVPTLVLNAPGTIFVDSSTVPLLQFPEGITSWKGKIYVATFNVATPTNSRILVFDTTSNSLINILGGQPGQKLISAGPLLGLTVDPKTAYLYAAANGTGQILQIRKPESATPEISIYATYPKGGGSEDLVFGKDGTLYGSDSNLGMVYSIPPGGGKLNVLIGPPGSGAQISDNKLFASPVPGLSPNGIVFGLDWRTFYVANTWSDSIIAFDVNEAGQVTGNPRVFAQHVNPDLEENPTGFDPLKQKDTKIGPSASTPLNGPDGLALDNLGHIWVASILGDNLTALDPKTGNVITTYGTSAVTQDGILNNPAGMTFVGDSVYCSNLGIFTGLAGKPNLSFRIAAFKIGVPGAGSNGNY